MGPGSQPGQEDAHPQQTKRVGNWVLRSVPGLWLRCPGLGRPLWISLYKYLLLHLLETGQAGAINS